MELADPDIMDDNVNEMFMKEEYLSNDSDEFICFADDQEPDMSSGDGVVTQCSNNDDNLETAIEYIGEDDVIEAAELDMALVQSVVNNGSTMYEILPTDFVPIGGQNEESIEEVQNGDAHWDLVEEVPETNVEDADELFEEATNDDVYFNNVQSATDAERHDEDQVIVLKDEPKSDQEEEGDKFFCCDCQNVFTDLKTAEDHNCLAGANVEPHETAASNVVPNDEGLSRDSNISRNSQSSDSNFSWGFEKFNDDNMSEDVEVVPVNQFKCSQCDKVFASIRGLSSHKRMHKSKQAVKKEPNPNDPPPEPAVCEICNTSFSLEKYLKLHMKIHQKREVRSIEEALPAGTKSQYSEMNKFFCEICNKSFEQNLLAIHKNMHQQTEEFNCRICNRYFQNKASFDLHMQMHDEKPTKERPLATVDNERKFPCQYCGRAFARPFEKVRHERVHTGEKPHKCEVCGKRFRVTYSLTLHLRTHTDIRPYVCPTCNKRFKSQPVYAHHLRTHLATRPYKCDICQKTFRTSVQLGAHKNSHLKPYFCPECNRPFATLYTVKIHMKTHNKFNKSNENLKHSCAVCGAVYARIFALRLHMKEQHAIDIDMSQHDEPQTPSSGMIDYEEETVEPEDAEAAVLIAAAAEADCAAYIEAAAQQSQSTQTTPLLDSAGEVMSHIILQNDEIIVDNYQAEEIVTDWLSK